MRRRPFFRSAPTAVCLVLTVWLAPHAAWAASTWAVKLVTGGTGQSKAQAVPAAPTGVAAACSAPTTSKVVKVTWSAVTHASGYAVYQATSSTSTPGTYTEVTTVTTTSYTTGTLTAGTNYWYKVVADIGTYWASAESTATGESTINSADPYCQQP